MSPRRVAIIPAISRSGATIAAALWSGLEAEAGGRILLPDVDHRDRRIGRAEARHIPPGADVFSVGLLLAFIAAAVSGLFAIRLLVGLLRHKKFHLFAPYCAVLGVVCLVWFGWLGK